MRPREPFRPLEATARPFQQSRQQFDFSNETNIENDRAWTGEFTDELRQRGVDEDRIKGLYTASVSTSSTPAKRRPKPSVTLGIMQRASGPSQVRSPPCTGSFVAAGLAAISLFVFGITSTRWIDGDAGTGLITLSLGSATVLLAASAWLTVRGTPLSGSH